MKLNVRTAKVFQTAVTCLSRQTTQRLRHAWARPRPGLKLQGVRVEAEEPAGVCVVFVQQRSGLRSWFPTLQSPQSHAYSASTQPTVPAISLLWIQRRIYPAFPTMPSSESSSLEEPTLGRHRFCRESVTPRRIQRSTGVMNQRMTIGYALLPISAFDLIISLG